MNSISGLEKTGVYFHYKNGKVIYVGKTEHPLERRTQHRSNGMDFDNIKFIPCELNQLDNFEKRWIEILKPKLNIQHNSDNKKKKKVKKRFKFIKAIKYYHNMHFRKLTEKSIIGIGTYKDVTVGQLLNSKKYLSIASLYYSMSHITFFDSILELVGITKEWTIEKPGKDKDKYFAFSKAVHPEEFEKRMLNWQKMTVRESKSRLGSLAKTNNSKRHHQFYNQGRPK